MPEKPVLEKSPGTSFVRTILLGFAAMLAPPHVRSKGFKSSQRSAVSFQLKFLCDLCAFFASSAVKTVSLNRKARKGFRKGRKYCGRTFEFCNPHDALSRRRAQLIEALVTLSHLVRGRIHTLASDAIIGPENSPENLIAVRQGLVLLRGGVFADGDYGG